MSVLHGPEIASDVCLFVHGTGPRHRNDLVSGRLALASSCAPVERGVGRNSYLKRSKHVKDK